MHIKCISQDEMFLYTHAKNKFYKASPVRLIISIIFACSALKLATELHSSPPTVLAESLLLFGPVWVEMFSACYASAAPQSVISQQMFLISGRRRTCGYQNNAHPSSPRRVALSSTHRVHCGLAGEAEADAGQTHHWITG